MTLQTRRPLRAVPGGRGDRPPADILTARQERAARMDQRRADQAELAAARAGTSNHPVVHLPVTPKSQEDRFPADVRALILARARLLGLPSPCEMSYLPDECWGHVDAHHRKLIGMGGSVAPEMHRASNGVAACRGHHGDVHGERMQLGEPNGLMLSRWNPDPSAAPVCLGGSWWLLGDDGGAVECDPPEWGGAA